ncbi:MAG: hypothetical protein BWY63_03441 [Chloroflexi bacterium ADurb.Bin360]|nr:MAG: hypothetical protein BWY63_03441 [Chloroflexi bacterium ADurb.Bin360]
MGVGIVWFDFQRGLELGDGGVEVLYLNGECSQVVMYRGSAFRVQIESLIESFSRFFVCTRLEIRHS